MNVSPVVVKPARKMVEAEKTENLEFKWGVLKGTGGKNRDVKFYKSFRYDGEDYDLYDCVYLYKEGEPEPEIGKIIKIWETPQKSRKVKILWFFRPCEIRNFLGDEKIFENELFLASGVGTGLHNLNPLEAIAGKCNVLCISKDKENPQPSDEELQKADFVFHRTFDVSQQKIMDKIEGKIADVDVKFLFNKINVQKLAGDLNVDLGENKVCDNDTKTNDTMVPSKQNSFKEPKNVETTRSSVDKHIHSVEKQKSAAVGLESGEMDQTDERQQDVSSSKTILCSKGRGREEEANLDNVLPRKLEVEETRSTKHVGDLDNRPTKKLKLDTSKASSDKINSHEPRHVEVDGICGRKNNAILDHTLAEKPNMNASRSGEHKHKVNANGSYMKDLSFVASLVDERCKLKGVEDTIGTNKSSTKKMKPDGNTSTPCDNKFPKSSHGDDESKVQSTSSPSSSIVDDRCKRKEESPVGDKDSKKKMKVGDKATNFSLVGDKDSKKKMKVGDKATNLSTGKPPKPFLRPPQNKTQKFDGQLLEVTQRADASDVDGNDSKASSPIAFGFDDSLGKHKAPFEKMKSDVKAPRLSNREMGEQSTTQSLIKSGEFDGQVVEVTQRPGTDRRKWFKNFPWQERMQAAHEQVTLILLQNLDPAYTSAEVEDIVWNGLGESCTAKMIQQTENSSHYYGQALVIFKNRETAKKVVRKLDEGCLLLSNGRPLVGSIATTYCSREKKPKFFGHLVIDKLRHPMINEREMREAVSTSHFSQPNTIEYDMSMEWCTQQEKSDLLWKSLYKQQWKEVRELKAKLKVK